MAFSVAQIDRCKAQLLNSGLSQKDSALFQIINTLIDAIRSGVTENAASINAVSGVVSGLSSGDVFGPASAVGDNITLFDGVTGKLIKDSGVAIGSIPSLPIDLTTDVINDLPDANLTANVPLKNATNAFTGANSFSVLVDLLVGQLKFPATQNPSTDVNTLDDYEEGNFTPTLRFGGLSTSIVYDTAAGRYVKIGKLVVCSARLSITSKGTATGNATLGGLPFTIAAGSNYGSGTPVGKFLNMASINNWFSTLAEDGTATIAMCNGGAINSAFLTDANFTNTTDFNFQLAYIAAN